MAWLLALALAGCAGRPTEQAVATPPPVLAPLPPAPPQLRPTPDLDGFLECVPLARAISGIEIYGDAWTWWSRAEGRYARGSDPAVGSVLALKRDNRLRLGHIAVVAAIRGPREILVTHANWGGDSRTRGVVHERQPVVDVSPANDWSQLRFMNTQGSYGRVYPAHGFIHPNTIAVAGS